MGGDSRSKGDFGRGIGKATHFARRLTDGKTIERTTIAEELAIMINSPPPPGKRKKEDSGRVWGGRRGIASRCRGTTWNHLTGRGGETQGKIRVLVLEGDRQTLKSVDSTRKIKSQSGRENEGSVGIIIVAARAWARKVARGSTG